MWDKQSMEGEDANLPRAVGYLCGGNLVVDQHGGIWGDGGIKLTTEEQRKGRRRDQWHATGLKRRQVQKRRKESKKRAKMAIAKTVDAALIVNMDDAHPPVKDVGQLEGCWSCRRCHSLNGGGVKECRVCFAGVALPMREAAIAACRKICQLTGESSDVEEEDGGDGEDGDDGFDSVDELEIKRRKYNAQVPVVVAGRPEENDGDKQTMEKTKRVSVVERVFRWSQRCQRTNDQVYYIWWSYIGNYPIHSKDKKVAEIETSCYW
jgi:hypothetical protein